MIMIRFMLLISLGWGLFGYPVHLSELLLADWKSDEMLRKLILKKERASQEERKRKEDADDDLVE